MENWEEGKQIIFGLLLNKCDTYVCFHRIQIIKNTVLGGCNTVSFEWVGLGWMEISEWGEA